MNANNVTADGERSAVAFLRSRGMAHPTTALVLGSGLGEYASRLQDPVSVPTSSIPFFPRSTVPGHAGWVHFGRIRDKERTSGPLLVFQGRVHPYEGGDSRSSSLNIRIAHALGARRIFITNAAGGIRPSLFAGSLMLHSDMMRLPQRTNPVSIEPQAILPSAIHTHTYDAHLSRIVADSAMDVGVELQRGTYCYVSGPSYETASEVRMLEILGADAVGMSTYPEVMESGRLDLPVVGLSLISNEAAGLSGQPLTHEEVTRVAGEAGIRLAKVVTESVLRMDG